MATSTVDRERPEVHPRVRQRYVEVRRAEGRRRLRVLIASMILLVLAMGAWASTRTSLLDIDHIEVVGALNADPQDVAMASGLQRGQAMSGIDQGAAAAGVEQLPLVRRAAVSRSWPNRVIIEIEEREPVAAVTLGSGAGVALVDIAGRVLSVQIAEPPGLGRLESGIGTPRPGELLDADLVASIDAVRRVPAALGAGARVRAEGDDLIVELPAGGRIRLDPRLDAQRQLVAAATLVGEIGADFEGEIDVRAEGMATHRVDPTCDGSHGSAESSNTGAGTETDDCVIADDGAGPGDEEL